MNSPLGQLGVVLTHSEGKRFLKSMQKGGGLVAKTERTVNINSF